MCGIERRMARLGHRSRGRVQDAGAACLKGIAHLVKGLPGACGNADICAEKRHGTL